MRRVARSVDSLLMNCAMPAPLLVVNINHEPVQVILSKSKANDEAILCRALTAPLSEIAASTSSAILNPNAGPLLGMLRSAAFFCATTASNVALYVSTVFKRSRM